MSETSLVNYNLGTLPSCAVGPPSGPNTALRAHYPPHAPALDHPFVPLSWSDEPGDEAGASDSWGEASRLLDDPAFGALADDLAARLTA